VVQAVIFVVLGLLLVPVMPYVMFIGMQLYAFLFYGRLIGPV